MELADTIRPPLPVQCGGFEFNYTTVFNSSLVVVAVALLAYWLTRRLSKYPGRKQVVAEFIAGAFRSLVYEAMGKRYGRLFLPVFGSLFLYIFVCNVLSLVPLTPLTWGLFPEHGLEISSEPILVDINDNGLWEPGEPFVDANGNGRRDAFLVPALEEPTRDLNVPLGLALWLAGLMYLSTVLLRGPLHIFKDLTDPYVPMLPLNLVGKVAEVVSVSFRLFGNIFGGAAIMLVAGALLNQLVFPVIGALFFGLFVGAVQAFVYSILWLTYTTNTLGAGPK